MLDRFLRPHETEGEEGDLTIGRHLRPRETEEEVEDFEAVDRRGDHRPREVEEFAIETIGGECHRRHCRRSRLIER